MTPEFFDMPAIVMMILGALVLYPLILGRLARFAEPLRLEAAELGEGLILDSHVPAWAKKMLKSDLDELTSFVPAMLAAVFFPVALLRVVAKLMRGSVPREKFTHPAAEAEFTRFQTLYIVSTMAANPMFGLLFAIEICVVLFCAAVIGVSYVKLRDLVVSIFQVGQPTLRNGTATV